MDKETLERVTAEAERVEPPLGAERVKPTEPSKEPTVGITETEEFRQELRKALGKSTESINRQLSLSKAEAQKAKAEIEQHKADLKAMEADFQSFRDEYDRLAEQQFADDPEARKAFLDRRAIAHEQRKLAKEKTEVERNRYETEKLAWSVRMAKKADTLVKETGIDVSELEACQTEEEMEVKALRFQIGKGTQAVEEPKFDSLVSARSGIDLSKMSPEDKLRWGLTHKKIR